MGIGKLLRRKREVRVTQGEWGAGWPFVEGIEQGLLQKRKTGSKPSFEAITFEVEGRVYALNGIAKATGDYRPLAEIWRDDPAHPDLKVSIGPMIHKMTS